MSQLELKGVRGKLSYWALKTFIDCPLRYKFLVEDGIRTPDKDFRGAIIGATLHYTVERSFFYSKSASWIFLNTPRYFAKLVDRAKILRWRSATDKEQTLQKCIEMAANMRDFLVEHSYIYGRKVEIEQKVYANITPDLSLGGKPDLQFIDDASKSIEIWDLKAVEDSIRLDKMQLWVYRYILGQLNPGYTISAMFVTPLLRKVIKPDFTEQMNQSYLSKVKETWYSIKQCRVANNFPPKPSIVCRYCEFKETQCV